MSYSKLIIIVNYTCDAQIILWYFMEDGFGECCTYIIKKKQTKLE